MSGPSRPTKASWKDDLRAKLFEQLRRRSLTPSQAIALICLADSADFHTVENARPSIATLAARCAVSTKTVERALKLGRELGVIQLVRRGGGSGQNSRGRTYRFPASQAHPTADRRTAQPLVGAELANERETKRSRFGQRRGTRPSEPESHWHREKRRRASAKRVRFAEE